MHMVDSLVVEKLAKQIYQLRKDKVTLNNTLKQLTEELKRLLSNSDKKRVKAGGYMIEVKTRITRSVDYDKLMVVIPTEIYDDITTKKKVTFLYINDVNDMVLEGNKFRCK